MKHYLLSTLLFFPLLLIAQSLPASAPTQICGNGTIEIGEECDDGSANSDLGPCFTNCQLKTFLEIPASQKIQPKQQTAYSPCGNGRIDQGEQCDDGNLQGNDGCSPACVYSPREPSTALYGGVILLAVGTGILIGGPIYANRESFSDAGTAIITSFTMTVGLTIDIIGLASLGVYQLQNK